MFLNKFIKGSLALLCIFPISVLANEIGLGGVVNDLEGPVGALVRLSLFACTLFGVIMIISAALQYRNHWQSPKLVPMSTPIYLLLIGIFALMIPYSLSYFESSLVTGTFGQTVDSPTFSKYREQINNQSDHNTRTNRYHTEHGRDTDSDDNQDIYDHRESVEKPY